MSLDLFLNLLTGAVIITIALTEALKKLLIASETPYRTNVVVLDSAMVASTGIAVIYRLPFGLGFEVVQVVRLLLLIVCTWFTSMFVYDKMVQTKEQYKRYKEETADEKHVEKLCIQTIGKYFGMDESGNSQSSQDNGSDSGCNNRYDSDNGCC